MSCIGLGGMPMSIQDRPDEAQSIAVIHAAVDAGITFIDTADSYCFDDSDIGHNERLIAKALKDRPSAEVVIATKGGLERPQGDWVTNGTPEHLKAACERSLRALEVEVIDLYQLHAPDPEVPFTDSVGALADLQREGKVRHIGLSNVTVAQIQEARKIAPIASVQNRCNIFDTAAFETGVVRYCHENQIAFLPHSAVGGHRGHARIKQTPEILKIAERRHASPYQVTLAYLLALSPCIIPIPGASKVENAISSAQAAEVELSSEDIAQIVRRFPKATVY